MTASGRYLVVALLIPDRPGELARRYEGTAVEREEDVAWRDATVGKRLEHAQAIRRYGAGIVVMAFDERGQADTVERKVEICERAYRLLTERAGFSPEDIVFDPNVLAVATGIEEHNEFAKAFIEALPLIKERCPGARTSGGISNLSFAFRGNQHVREAMHAAFLYHAIRAGLDMSSRAGGGGSGRSTIRTRSRRRGSPRA